MYGGKKLKKLQLKDKAIMGIMISSGCIVDNKFKIIKESSNSKAYKVFFLNIMKLN